MPEPLLKPLYRPFQPPGQDVVVREVCVPVDVDHGLDVRCYLHADDLQKLLDLARASRTQRVVVHGAQVRLVDYRGGDGHVYTALTFRGRIAEPEDPTILVPRLGASGGVLR